eukprot:scaffold244647_cov18-Tisochrysis_lutea.AAC.1
MLQRCLACLLAGQQLQQICVAHQRSGPCIVCAFICTCYGVARQLLWEAAAPSRRPGAGAELFCSTALSIPGTDATGAGICHSMH